MAQVAYDIYAKSQAELEELSKESSQRQQRIDKAIEWLNNPRALWYSDIEHFGNIHYITPLDLLNSTKQAKDFLEILEEK